MILERVTFLSLGLLWHILVQIEETFIPRRRFSLVLLVISIRPPAVSYRPPQVYIIYSIGKSQFNKKVVIDLV